MYQLTSRVRYSEVDENSILTIPAAMRYLTDCATFQSDDCGFDVGRLLYLDQGWYVVSWQVDISYLPREGQSIVVKTMPYNITGMMGYRDFIMETEDGRECLKANSTWIYMDLKRQKPIRVSDEMKEGFGQDEAIDFKWMDRKVNLCSELVSAMDKGECDCKFNVKQSHLDTNHHMNNAVYIESAMDLIPKDAVIKYLRAEYKSVAFLDDEVCMKSVPIDGGAQIVLYTADKVYATVEVYYD